MSRRERKDRGPRAHRPRHDAPGSVTLVFGKAGHDSNELGPIFFVTPELGPLSKTGGLLTMVWELAMELVSLRQDVTIISPYYNVGHKGETNHLKKYGIEHDRSIDVYGPDKYEVGLHYGVVDGSGSFLATPYPTGPTFYSSSSLRSPSSSSARSASALMLKRR